MFRNCRCWDSEQLLFASCCHLYVRLSFAYVKHFVKYCKCNRDPAVNPSLIILTAFEREYYRGLLKRLQRTTETSALPYREGKVTKIKILFTKRGPIDSPLA